MPRKLQFIDAIAREKKRDVLYITFSNMPDGKKVLTDWEENNSRKIIIEWLDANDYVWTPCGGEANIYTMIGYRGSIYIDVPFKTEDPAYRILETFLEYPDGTMRFSEMTFFFFPLSLALKNAGHDEPGFWEKWAENF